MEEGTAQWIIKRKHTCVITIQVKKKYIASLPVPRRNLQAPSLSQSPPFPPKVAFVLTGFFFDSFLPTLKFYVAYIL